MTNKRGRIPWGRSQPPRSRSRTGSGVFASRRRQTRYWRDWSTDVWSSDLPPVLRVAAPKPVTPRGVLEPLGTEGARAVVHDIAELGVESVAVCLLHTDRYPEHERAIGANLDRKSVV